MVYYVLGHEGVWESGGRAPCILDLWHPGHALCVVIRRWNIKRECVPFRPKGLPRRLRKFGWSLLACFMVKTCRAELDSWLIPVMTDLNLLWSSCCSLIGGSVSLEWRDRATWLKQERCDLYSGGAWFDSVGTPILRHFVAVSVPRQIPGWCL